MAIGPGGDLTGAGTLRAGVGVGADPRQAGVTARVVAVDAIDRPPPLPPLRQAGRHALREPVRPDAAERRASPPRRSRRRRRRRGGPVRLPNHRRPSPDRAVDDRINDKGNATLMTPTLRFRAAVIAGWIALGSSPALADAGHVPSQMVAVDARSAGLVATSGPDRGVANANTAKLNNLLKAYGLGGAQGPGDKMGPRTVYIPAGTYYFSDTVYFARCRLRVLGAGAEQTKLVLLPGADGFNGASPKPFVRTASCEGSPTDGNEAHDNIIEHLSIDVGSNAKAVGLRFLAANFGLLSHVNIRSDSKNVGARGLEFISSVGPAYIKDVAVSGFDVGIYMDKLSPNILTLVDVKVSDQGTAGLVNEGKNITLERFSSVDNPQGIITRTDLASLVILESSFAGLDGADLPAIELANGGMAYLREVSATRHSSLLANVEGVGTGGMLDVAEWSTLDLSIGNLTQAARADVNMDAPGAGRAPVAEAAPDFHETSVDQHFLVEGMNASPTTRADDQVAFIRSLQANRTKTTANVPRGHYSFRKAAFVGGSDLNVRKIDFNWSFLSKGSGAGEVFEVGDTGDDYLIVENLFTNMTFKYSGSKKLVLRNIKSAGSGDGSFTVTATGTGKVFVENAATGVNSTVNPGSEIILRGIDRGGNTHLQNLGGRLTVIGDNVEINPRAGNSERTDLNPNPQIITRSGGKTIVYGGTYDTNTITRRPEQGPLFIASGDDACMFVVAGGLNRKDGGGWGLWPKVISDNEVNKDSDYLRYFYGGTRGFRRLTIPPYRSQCF